MLLVLMMEKAEFMEGVEAVLNIPREEIVIAGDLKVHVGEGNINKEVMFVDFSKRIEMAVVNTYLIRGAQGYTEG